MFGLGLVVADQAVDFRSEYCRNRLLIDVGVSDFNRYGSISFQVTNSELETVVCRARPEWCFLTLISTDCGGAGGAC